MHLSHPRAGPGRHDRPTDEDPPSEEVIQWTTQHNFLNGAVISDVLETMTGSGVKQSNHVHDDGPARSVNWTDSALLSNAISLGPLGYDRNHRRTLIGGHHP